MICSSSNQPQPKPDPLHNAALTLAVPVSQVACTQLPTSSNDRKLSSAHFTILTRDGACACPAAPVSSATLSWLLCNILQLPLPVPQPWKSIPAVYNLRCQLRITRALPILRPSYLPVNSHHNFVGTPPSAQAFSLPAWCPSQKPGPLTACQALVHVRHPCIPSCIAFALLYSVMPQPLFSPCSVLSCSY